MIHVVERGTGPAVLMLHGIGGSADSFAPQLTGLAESLRMIAWDAPGYALRPFVTELWLVATIMAVLIVPFFTKKANLATGAVALSGLLFALACLFIIGPSDPGTHFRGLLVSDHVSVFWKATLLIFTAGVVLIAFGILASTRASVSLTARSVSPLALIAAILAIVSALWAAVALPAQLADVAATADRLRYMSLSAPAFFSGFLWSTGIVMGAISLRSPSVLSKVLSIAAVVLGFAVMATNIWAAAIYSAGLTD